MRRTERDRSNLVLSRRRVQENTANVRARCVPSCAVLCGRRTARDASTTKSDKELDQSDMLTPNWRILKSHVQPKLVAKLRYAGGDVFDVHGSHYPNEGCEPLTCFLLAALGYLTPCLALFVFSLSWFDKTIMKTHCVSPVRAESFKDVRRRIPPPGAASRAARRNLWGTIAGTLGQRRPQSLPAHLPGLRRRPPPSPTCSPTRWPTSIRPSR